VEFEGRRGIRRRRGKERYLTGSQAPKGEGLSFLEWFARVRKYFVRDEKFRSEISRFRRACDSRRVRFREGVRVLKLEGFNLKVKLKLKCLKGVPEGGIPEGGVLEGGVVFDRFPKVRDRRFGQGLLWWFAEVQEFVT
jgi:hypothetical protein